MNYSTGMKIRIRRILPTIFTGLMSIGLMTAVPSLAEAAVQCQTQTRPRIEIKPNPSRVSYNFSQNKSQLNTINVDTISPYGPDHNTNVGGLMSGSIQLKNNVSFIYETYEHLGMGCVYLKSVDIQIDLNPTIYVAKEYPQGSCLHNSILVHEHKHAKEDQLIVNKYINLFGRKVDEILQRRGYSFGPMKQIRMKEIQDEIRLELQTAISDLNETMNAERRKRQQAIDNLEEYKSITDRCPRS